MPFSMFVLNLNTTNNILAIYQCPYRWCLVYKTLAKSLSCYWTTISSGSLGVLFDST